MTALSPQSLWPIDLYDPILRGHRQDDVVLDLTKVVEPEEELAEVFALVDRLTNRLVESTERAVLAERERDEAIEVGLQIADQRDQYADLLVRGSEALVRANAECARLRRKLAMVREAIERIASLPKAVVARERLIGLIHLAD